jgi:hypothetical protein
MSKKPARPPEHIGEPRPEPLPPLDRFKCKPVDESRMLRWLLREAILRLRAARRLERDRKIIFPETGVCLRDVERITRRLNSHFGQADDDLAGLISNYENTNNDT